MNFRKVPTTSLLDVTLYNLGIYDGSDIDWLGAVSQRNSNGLPHPLNFHCEEEIAEVATLGYTQVLVARSIYLRCAAQPPLCYNELLDLAQKVRSTLATRMPMRTVGGTIKQAPLLALVRVVALLAVGSTDLSVPQMVSVVFGTHTPASLACDLEPAYINQRMISCASRFMQSAKGLCGSAKRAKSVAPTTVLDACVRLQKVDDTLYKRQYPVSVVRINGFDIDKRHVCDFIGSLSI